MRVSFFAVEITDPFYSNLDLKMNDARPQQFFFSNSQFESFFSQSVTNWCIRGRVVFFSLKVVAVVGRGGGRFARCRKLSRFGTLS